MPPPSAAVALFEQISTAGYPWIQGACQEKTPETLHLDFKNKATPDQAGAERKDFASLAEALSGFGNSEGGVIVFGVDARKPAGDQDVPDGADSEKPITAISRFRTDLEGQVAQLTSPPVPGVRFLTLKVDPSVDKGFLVVLIPEGDNPPYMSQRGRTYHGRAGSSFFTLENYQVRDLLVRRSSPNLVLVVSVSGFARSARDIEYDFSISLQNTGRAIAKWPAIKFRQQDFSVSEFELDGNRNPGLAKLATHDGSRFYSGGPTNDAIHPGETRPVTRTRTLSIPRSDWDRGNIAPNLREFTIPFEIFAENMPSKSGTATVTIARMEASLRRRASGVGDELAVYRSDEGT